MSGLLVRYVSVYRYICHIDTKDCTVNLVVVQIQGYWSHRCSTACLNVQVIVHIIVQAEFLLERGKGGSNGFRVHRRAEDGEKECP